MWWKRGICARENRCWHLEDMCSIITCWKNARIVEARILEQRLTEISTKDLMKQVLEPLRKENEEWHRNWIIYDRAVKKRRPEE